MDWSYWCWSFDYVIIFLFISFVDHLEDLADENIKKPHKIIKKCNILPKITHLSLWWMQLDNLKSSSSSPISWNVWYWPKEQGRFCEFWNSLCSITHIEVGEFFHFPCSIGRDLSTKLTIAVKFLTCIFHTYLVSLL